MKRFGILLWIVLSVICVNTGVWGSEPCSLPICHDYKQLSQDLQSLKTQHSGILRLSSLAESQENRSVWMLEAGKGKSDDLRQRPAMLVVGGVEGDQLAGTEAAIAFLEYLCSGKDCVQSLLDNVTFYVIPRLNPDAAERFFLSPRYAQSGNLTPFDADHDGLVDEDGPDDLNGDGVISWVRVKDAEGSLIKHPNEERILIEADAGKGETGEWLLFSEGKDNDGDEKINEDGPGEVNFNKSFPFNYTFFEADVGMYQLCEKETRAVAEFVIEHPNIGIAMIFSSNGSLLKTPESGESSGRGKPQTKLREEDAKYFDYLGEQYRELVGIEKTVDSPSVNGALSDWIYFHRGRMSVSTPVWSPGIAVALKKEEKKADSGEAAEDEKKPDDGSGNEDGEEKEEKKKDDDRGQTERDYLKWVEENAPDYFMEWTKFEHPDYPGQEAETGGFKPFAKVLPPSAMFDEVMKKNAEYLAWLAGKLPRIEIHDTEVKDLGSGIFDVCIKVRNTGYLPTVLAHGERTREVFPTRVEIDIPKERILGGEALPRVGKLEGSGGMKEVRWVLHAEAGKKIKVRVISALGGCVEEIIEMKGE